MFLLTEQSRHNFGDISYHVSQPGEASLDGLRCLLFRCCTAAERTAVSEDIDGFTGVHLHRIQRPPQMAGSATEAI